MSQQFWFPSRIAGGRRDDNNDNGQGERTEVFQYLAGVAALPQQPPRVGTHNPPRPEVDGHFVGRPLEKLSRQPGVRRQDRCAVGARKARPRAARNYIVAW